jgi:hypothetical protein
MLSRNSEDSQTTIPLLYRFGFVIVFESVGSCTCIVYDECSVIRRLISRDKIWPIHGPDSESHRFRVTLKSQPKTDVLILTDLTRLLTMASSKAALSGIDPLKDLLSDVLARLETLEAKAGVSAAYPSAAKSPIPVKATLHGMFRSVDLFRYLRSIPQFWISVS